MVGEAMVDSGTGLLNQSLNISAPDLIFLMYSKDPTFKHFYRSPERSLSYFNERVAKGEMSNQDVVEIIVSRNTYGRVTRVGSTVIGHFHYKMGRKKRNMLNSLEEGKIGIDEMTGDYDTAVYIPFDVEFERDGKIVKLWSYVKGNINNSPDLKKFLSSYILLQ
jgi:hypothetical protein